jgi:short-subunit dehydrogenase
MVCCAGTGDYFSTAGVCLDGDTFRVNLVGLADAIAVVLPAMQRQGCGRMIGVSSIGDMCTPSAPSYGASKAAMTAYLLGLRSVLMELGVSVSVVRFGFVDTKMAKAPVRPQMIDVEAAAKILMRVMEHGPAVRAYPLLMDLVGRAVRIATYWWVRRPL